MYSIVLALLACAISIAFYFRRKSRQMDIYKLPRPPSYPLIGCVLQLTDEENMSRRILQEWPEKYGPRFIFQIPGRSYFLSTKFSDLEKILSSTTLMKKGSDYDLFKPWLGNGLLVTSHAPEWSKWRKLLNPCFMPRILDQFLPVFNKQARIMIEILSKDSNNGHTGLNICQYSNLCALDILCETAMGKELNAQQEKKSEYVNAINDITKILVGRAMRPWLHPQIIWKLSPFGRQEDKCLKILHGFTDQVIKERKAEILERRDRNENLEPNDNEESIFMTKKRRALAFMDLMLNLQADNPDEISDADIRAQTDNFMFAGHDTTATNLAWTVYLLGLYPQEQERALEEIISVLGDDLCSDVTSIDLTKLKYLDCCIQEALRLYSSVAIVAREITEDLVLDDGLVVPKGFNFLLNPQAVHQDPVTYPEPKIYKPERFLPENSIGRHPYAFVPFSMGPRNCIGKKFALMEEKVILAHFIRKFRIESITPEHTIVLKHEVVIRPKDGLVVRLHPRSNAS